MEFWERDFEWLKVRHIVKKAFHKSQLPDFQSVLFLIGVQEYGKGFSRRFSKEEKQDLMHVAVCTLLEPDGIYEFEGRDHDGWPHWKQIKPLRMSGVEQQETYLKEKIIEYFRKYNELDDFDLPE